jgi:hypothetical protein
MLGPTTVVICHAREDAEFAREAAAMVEQNVSAHVSYEESAGDFLGAVERAISGDVVLAILSSHSATPWKRQRWEAALVDAPREFGTQIVFLLADECKFPDLLRRRIFFDSSRASAAGLRAFKRWLLEQSFGGGEKPAHLPPQPAEPLAPENLERLLIALADRPGVAELAGQEALGFARGASRDFEGVFWIHCGGRSRAGVLGDLAHSLGLRLTGPVESNREAICTFCLTRRCLFLFADLDSADREWAGFGGKSSIIFTSDFERPQIAPADLMQLFAAWPRNVDSCAAELGRAQTYFREILDDGVAAEFGLAILAVLKHLDRLAEASELLDLLADAARRAGDPLRAHRLAWERSWIQESWDRPGEVTHAPPSAEPHQLSLWSASSAES